MIEADTRECGFRLLHKGGLALEIGDWTPAPRRQREQRQRDVVQNGVAMEQRDDLISPRHAPPGAVAARIARYIAAVEFDAAAIGLYLTHDQVEERRLAGPVRPDDEMPDARLQLKSHIARHAQAAERFHEPFDSECAHGVPPLRCSAVAARFTAGEPAEAPDRPRKAWPSLRARRIDPGIRPSGMKLTIRTKMTPST